MTPKVLYVINGLGTGGAERSLAELLPYFRRAGISPTIACFYRRAEGVENQVIAQGFPVKFLDEHRRLPARVAALRRLIAAEQPEIIHTTIFEADLVGRLAAIGSRCKVLTSLVNTSYDRVRLNDPNVSRNKLRLVQLLDGWTARHLTDHFHAITHTVKQSAMQSLGISAERITVIERGRDPARLGENSAERHVAARHRLGLDDGCLVLLNVGRQEFQKGQRYLVEAIAQLAPTRPRLVLLIAGRQGNASAELQGLCRQKKVIDQVRFLGHRDDIPELLAAADLFVFPSLYEGLGTALIEAMALGLPIVASKIPAIAEVVEEGKNALLVQPASPVELANAIDTLLTDSNRAARFSQQSRDIFENRFTLERSASRMVELYHRIGA
ncbi:MAG: glycosyltransferase family 4 protein [Caldilineaceae bacterium]|nr:glycosyltransferase family 4 protein [Caldilineaceae bacterium]